MQLKSRAEPPPKWNKKNKTSSWSIAQIAGTQESCHCECSFFTYMCGVCSCVHLCLNTCIIHLRAWILCGHMFTGAHGDLKVLLSLFLSYSQFYLLRQGLSLNLQLVKSYSVGMQLGSRSPTLCSQALLFAMYSMLYVDAGDLNSIPHICIANASSTEPSLKPMCSFEGEFGCMSDLFL